MNKIKAIIDFTKSKPQYLLLICYLGTGALIAAVSLITVIFNFVAYNTGYYDSRELCLTDFEQVGVEIVDDMTMINATNDTQLIYSGNIKNIYIKCSFSIDPGEFVAFYSGKNNYSFGVNKMIHARKEGDYYVFRFPANTKQVRIDTGVEPSIKVGFEEIKINKQTFRDNTGISTETLFNITVIPLILFSLIYTAGEAFVFIVKKVENNGIRHKTFQN